MDDMTTAVRLLETKLGATVVEVLDPCRRCGRQAMAAPVVGDPPGPWCVTCRPHRRLDTSRGPWAQPSCRYGCPGPAGYYHTPAGGRIGPVCSSHAPPPCHWKDTPA